MSRLMSPVVNCLLMLLAYAGFMLVAALLNKRAEDEQSEDEFSVY